MNNIIITKFSDFNPNHSNYILYFENDKECFNFYDKPFLLDNIYGFLLPDEDLMCRFQYKFYNKYCDIGSAASILDPDDYKINDNIEYDFYCHASTEVLDELYRIYSKIAWKKWVICVEDLESKKLFHRLTHPNLKIITSFDEDIQSKCRFILDFPCKRRYPPRRIGVALCQNKPIIAVHDKHFFDGFRNISHWDKLLTSQTCRMCLQYGLEERILSFCSNNNYKSILKVREYYKEFLGKENLLEKLI